MRHKPVRYAIRGYALSEEVACFKIDLSLSVIELASIMGWVEGDDYLYVYKLTKQQAMDIEKACFLEFPKNLELYLNCYAL